MYSLDINFLNDRTDRTTDFAARTPAARGGANNTPMFVGLAVGAAALIFVGAFWGILQKLNADDRERLAELDAQLAAQSSFQAQLTSLTQEAQQAEAEAQALVTVFDQIKPWSALLQSIRDSVPSGVQIATIEQTEGEIPPAPAPAANAAPNAEAADPNAPAPLPQRPPSLVNVSGYATSFDNVNDFLLVLQRSPFFEAESTRLIDAQLVDYPERIELPEGAPSGVEVRVPQVVQYNIEATLTDLPASELLAELESALAVGLTARIQALRDRGAFQQ
jgi:type IV pilus assembly protein PilN